MHSSFALISILALVRVNSRETKLERLHIRAIVNREIEFGVEVAKSTSTSTSKKPSTASSTSKTEQLESFYCLPETCLLLIRKNLKCSSNHWEARWLLNNVSFDGLMHID